MNQILQGKHILETGPRPNVEQEKIMVKTSHKTKTS